MGSARRFRNEDAADVATLWVKAFCAGACSAEDSVARYLQESLLGNPWYDEEVSSLVYEEKGRVVGFLGVMARPMVFRGLPIRAAVATQLLVDKDQPSAFVPGALMRELFEGPQDFTYSDGATDLARRIFESAGGEVASLYAPQWTRVLRPAAHLAARFKRGKILTPWIGLSLPVYKAFDAVAVRIKRGPYRLQKATAADSEPCDTDTLWRLRELIPAQSLMPVYTCDSFRWLIEQASEQELHGVLQKNVVRDRKGQVAGWFLYYVKPRGVAQVLQLFSKPRSAALVLTRLFQHARSHGAVAVSGQGEPSMALDLAKAHCGFTWSGGVVIHSRNPEILDAVRRGDAGLTRLEGEWWMRFCDLAESKVVIAEKEAEPSTEGAAPCAE